MTQIVPVTAGTAGYVALAAMGHPTAAPFVAAGAFALGWLGKYAGHGIHLNRAQKRQIEYFTHRAIAANWAIRPLADLFEPEDQQRLLGSVFDAVAGEQLQNLLEQWPVVWAHVQRVHFSGIPPLASLKAMRRAYRPGLFGKDKAKARELAQPVVDAYATLHPSPESAREWYLRWAGTVGLPEQAAQEVWSDAMDRRRHRETSAAEVATGTGTPAPAHRVHLSEAEIERRLAENRV